MVYYENTLALMMKCAYPATQINKTQKLAAKMNLENAFAISEA